jgi:hypothetical protein
MLTLEFSKIFQTLVFSKQKIVHVTFTLPEPHCMMGTDLRFYVRPASQTDFCKNELEKIFFMDIDSRQDRLIQTARYRQI